MWAWLNLASLIVSTLLFWFVYARSVGPAALEARIGERSYRVCARYRLAAAVLMSVASANYVLYRLLPLPIELARVFPWPWWVSALAAAVIAIPSGILWWRGVRDAGEETMVPKKEHTLYGGIYEQIRHPQAVGELLTWWVMAFLLHSPFLALYSFVWVGVFYAISAAEERDLVLRYGEPYLAYQQRTGMFLPRRRVEQKEGR